MPLTATADIAAHDFLQPDDSDGADIIVFWFVLHRISCRKVVGDYKESLQFSSTELSLRVDVFHAEIHDLQPSRKLVYQFLSIDAVHLFPLLPSGT